MDIIVMVIIFIVIATRRKRTIINIIVSYWHLILLISISEENFGQIISLAISISLMRKPGQILVPE